MALPVAEAMSGGGEVTRLMNATMPTKVNAILVIALAVFSAGTELQGAVFHVSGDTPQGGDGFEARPFCTLYEAVAAARKMPGPNEIVVADGRYFFDRTLSLNARDSGLAIRAAHPARRIGVLVVKKGKAE